MAGVRTMLLLATLTVMSFAVATPAGPITHASKLIDSPLEDIQWADSQTVFILTEMGHLYRSDDGGKAWTPQRDKLHASSSTPTVRSIHISRADPRHIFFMGHGRENWVSEDMGRTYRPTEEINIHEVRLHPRQSKWLLAAGMSPGCDADPKKDCYKVMYMSKDFGTSFITSVTYVVQFDWAPTNNSIGPRPTPSHADVIAKPAADTPPDHDDDLVYATIHSVKRANQKFGMWDKDIHFYQSFDYFRTKVEVVKHGNRFLFGEHEYLFVAAVNPHQETEVSLQVSRERGANRKFKTALLPVDLTEHSYTILDTSQGSVFLHVNHAPFDANSPTGHVYISDWSGTRYSLSLPYNHRSPDGKCDFEKVEGLEGVYLANFIDEDEPDVREGWEEESNKHEKKLKAKTVITFDKGGIWSYLMPPAKDANGGDINCPADQSCHLHLHGITDLYGPFYSTASATGIIMSTGVVGRYLQERPDQINTYLSRDAGLTWFEVAKGSHIYEFGDHGGIIVMAYDEGETDVVLYSWDQGMSWKKLKIADTTLQVENIIIQPEATSQQFIVYGWQGDSGILIYLDFSELHQRQCKGHDALESPSSDYEEWSPHSDGRLGGRCLMGHKVTYVRRKRESQCFNPEQFEKGLVHENCACTEEDFECDYGYYRKTQGGPCVKDPDADPEPEEPCQDFYYVTKGYRRVAGDTCVGGEQWDRMQIPCPTWLGGSHIGKIMLGILLFVVIALGFATFYHKSEFLEDLVDSIRSRLRIDYDIVGGKRQPVSMADNDDFGLDDQEAQSAALITDTDHIGDDAAPPLSALSSSSSSSSSSSASSSGPALAPLPQRAAKPANVPLLHPPPEHDASGGDVDDFDPRHT